jgi:hypothetical protein
MSELEGEPIEDEGGVSLQFYVPEPNEEGTYANSFAIWHTAYEFTIDFAVSQVIQPVNPEEPAGAQVVPMRVVSRIRLPVGLVFDLIKSINERMAAYEAEWGEIHAPERREGEEE